jgi:acetoin utilization protein AcuB
MPTVQEIMTPLPIRVSASTSLPDAARLMLNHRIRHLPITDDRGRPTALLTDMDVFARGTLTPDEHLWIGWDADAERVTAGEIATGVVLTTSGENDLGATCVRMVRHHADSALVVDSGGALVGILTEHDGVRWAGGCLGAEVTEREESSSPVFGIDRHAPLSQARELFRVHRIRHLLVVDDGKLFGVLSLRDLLAGENELGHEPVVGFLASTNPLFAIREGATLASAAGMMLENHIGCLPVLDADGVPVRILTRADVIAAAVAGGQRRALFNEPSAD